MGLTHATFNSVGKLDVNKVLLNSSAKVSEQLSFKHLKWLNFFSKLFSKLPLVYSF